MTRYDALDMPTRICHKENAPPVKVRRSWQTVLRQVCRRPMDEASDYAISKWHTRLPPSISKYVARMSAHQAGLIEDRCVVDSHAETVGTVSRLGSKVAPSDPIMTEAPAYPLPSQPLVRGNCWPRSRSGVFCEGQKHVAMQAYARSKSFGLQPSETVFKTNAGLAPGLSFAKHPAQMGEDQNPGNVTTATRTLDDKV